MRLRKLALAVGLAGTLGAQLASALGLGEIKLESRLNEPLEAEIKLLQVRDLTKSEILVDLASNDDFQRAGIDRVFFLTDLRFEVDMDAPSGPVIRVTSKKPVREPYLNFLLESQWPNGRILREYTLLMDLPTFSDQKAAPVQSASTSTPRTTTRSSAQNSSSTTSQSGVTSDSSQPSASRTSQSRSTPAYQGDVYGPVGSNDTLWEIALKIRPSRQYSVQQTMLAVQRLNPEAFINGNINLLRKGQVLRVPTGSDIENVGAQQAVSEVAQQNSEWSDYTGAPQLEGSKRQRASAGSSSDGVSGRLTVAGADTSDSVQSGRAAGEVGGDTAALQNELAISLEELDSSRRENAELKDRVAEMEEQIETMERLLEVSSKELQALQQAAASNSSESQEVAQSSADPQFAEQVEAPVAAQPDAAKPAEQPKAKDATKADSSKVVRSAKSKEPSFMDMIMDNILYIGAGAVAILAGVFLLLRRRKDEEEDLDEGYAPAASAVEPEEPEADIDAAIESGVADDFDMADDDFDLSDEDELVSEAPTESQTGDAVGEADIYIAYGKFDQAEEMLQGALEQDSTNTAARLKLMEVYLETQDLDKFDQQYGEVATQGDAAAVARADDLRQQFADAPAYTEAEDENEFSLADEELEFDLGDSDQNDSEADSDEYLSLDDGAETGSDSDFAIGEDFSLSFESELTSGEQTAKAEDPEEELSFDLGGADDLDADSFELELDDAATDDSLELDLSDVLADEPADEKPDSEAEDLTFDLSGSEDSLGLDLSDSDLDEEPLDLELDSSDKEDDTFDLEMEDMDLAALDEEVYALSENMDFAGEEFASDDSLELTSELELDDVESNEFDAGSLEFDSSDSEELSLDLDDVALDSLNEQADKETTSESDLVSELEFESDVDFDLDLADFESDASEDNLDLSMDDVPTLEETTEAEAPVEEFDLAADLGLDSEELNSEASEDDMFSEAVSELPTPEDVMDGDMSDEDFDAELDFLADTDEAATKLDLARAYIDMGDQDGAKDILGEVVVEGNDTQKKEAEELLTRIG